MRDLSSVHVNFATPSLIAAWIWSSGGYLIHCAIQMIKSWNSFSQFLQVVEVKTLPVCWVRTVDKYHVPAAKKSIPVATIALASSIGATTVTDDTVFTTDSTNFSFYWDTFSMSFFNDIFRQFMLSTGKVNHKHDWSATSLDTFKTSSEATMVKVNSNWYSNTHWFYKVFNKGLHTATTHVFSSTHRSLILELS